MSHAAADDAQDLQLKLRFAELEKAYVANVPRGSAARDTGLVMGESLPLRGAALRCMAIAHGSACLACRLLSRLSLSFSRSLPRLFCASCHLSPARVRAPSRPCAVLLRRSSRRLCFLLDRGGELSPLDRKSVV